MMLPRPRFTSWVIAPSVLALALATACEPEPDDGPPTPQSRPATTTELIGLVRANLVRIGNTEIRAAKAFEGTKAWSDAEADPIDCDLASGACEAEVGSGVDDIIEELFDPALVVRTTETETVYADAIELGMSPYPVEWALSSPAPDQVVLRLWLGAERTVAGQVRLSPTGAVVEANLAAFQTVIEMSSAMDELEDSDLIQGLTGSAAWTLELTGPRSLRTTAEVQNLGFEVSFMDGAALTYASTGFLRVSANQDGEQREARTSVTLPAGSLRFPARLLQDDWRTRCDTPSDPCVPEATETVTFVAAGATFQTSGAADSGAFQLDHSTNAGVPWLSVSADGTEVARAELSAFAMELQSAAEELLIRVSSQLGGSFDFDVSNLGHIIDAPADFQRESFTASAGGRVSLRTIDQRGTIDILRVLEGQVAGAAAGINQQIRVDPGQCLLGLRSARSGIPDDHPFAYLMAGACQN
jgi:hypothetical protein